MHILLTGATGFVGKRLSRALARRGHSLSVLSRDSRSVGSRLGLPVQAWSWQSEMESPPAQAFSGVEAVIHLAGEAVAEKRWSSTQKKKIYDSRVLGTRNLLLGLRASKPPHPKIVICASAIGYYGKHGEEPITERVSSRQRLFGRCRRSLGGGGAYQRARGHSSGTAPHRFRSRPGGRHPQALHTAFQKRARGTNRQWEAVDELDSYRRSGFSLPLCVGKPGGQWRFRTGVSPNPVMNAEFTAALGKALHRPTFFTAPAFALRLAMGEMAHLALEGQRVRRSGLFLLVSRLPIQGSRRRWKIFVRRVSVQK